MLQSFSLFLSTLLTTPAIPAAAAPPSVPPNPTVTSAPQEVLKPLREIGRVKATTAFCSAIIDHATRAVALGIDNDHRLDTLVVTMRMTDFDSNMLAKNRALQTLTGQYVPLAEQTKQAEVAVRALRADARNAPDDREAKALTKFADAFEGAIHRQRTIARDLASMIAIFNNRPAMTAMEREQLKTEAQLSDTRRGSVTYDNPQEAVTPLLSTLAKDGADQIVYRQTGILQDEETAALLVEPTFGGC